LKKEDKVGEARVFGAMNRTSARFAHWRHTAKSKKSSCDLEEIGLCGKEYQSTRRNGMARRAGEGEAREDH